METKSRGCLATGLVFLAWVVAGGFIVTLPFALTGGAFGRVIFRPDMVSSSIRENLIEAGFLESFIQDQVLQGDLPDSDEESLGRYFEFLSPFERSEIISALIPPDWIEKQFNQVLRDVYGWLDDDRLLPMAEIDMAPFKANLLRGGIPTLVETVINSWPSCKPEQAEAFQQSLFETGRLPSELCEPPEPLRSRAVDFAMIAFEQQVQDMPETVPLIGETAPEEALLIKEQLRFYRGIMMWGWMLPLSLLGIIMALVIRTWQGVGRWWGLPLILGGLGTFVVALLMAGLREELIGSWVQGIAREPALQEVLAGMLGSLYGAAMGRLWARVFLVLMAGLLIWGVSRRLGGRKSGGEMATPNVPEQSDHIAVTVVDQSDENGEPPSGIFG